MDDKTVTVYVRKGGRDDSRTFSFKRLDEIPDDELLDLGVAIDGNQVMFEILPDEDGDYQGPFVLSLEDMEKLRRGEALGPDPSRYGPSLSEAIVQVERHLGEWFKEIDYEVEFA